MEFIKFWLTCGVCVTFCVLALEYLVNYDRVKNVIADNEELAQYESFMRIISVLIMVVIWPWTVLNYVIGFVKGFIEAFKNHE